KEGDRLFDAVMKEGDIIHAAISRGERFSPEIHGALARLNQLNRKLTALEDEFSYVLGEGSRWCESTLFFVLLLVVIGVEFTGLFLTLSFSRHLSRGLREISE